MFSKFSSSFKTPFAFLTLFMFCVGVFFSSTVNKALAFPPEETLIATAHKITDDFSKGNFDAVYQTMDATMKGSTNVEFWGKAWGQLLQQTGAFNKIGATRVTHEQGHAVVEHTLEFANTKLIHRVVFDKNGKVAGLFFKPGEVIK